MSRLIVKNLPKDLTEAKFKEHFGKKGEVTDAKVMRTKDGASRRFGFIGFKNEKAAESALNYFNGTFIHTSKIVVEKALPYGSEAIPRAWSKYTDGTSANVRLTGGNSIKTDKKNDFQVEETEAFKQQKEKLIQHVNQLKADEKDPKLREYLDVMTSRSKGKTWTNDDLATLKSYTESKLHLNNDNNDDDQEKEKKIAANIHDSDDDLYDDLPFNKDNKKISDKNEGDDDEDEPMDEDDNNNNNNNDLDDTPMEENNDNSKKNVNFDDLPERAKLIAEQEAKETNPVDLIEDTGRLFVRNLPYACTEQDLRETFEKYGPLSEVHMPIARDTKQSKGYAYILYLLPEHAVKAYKELDMKSFQGRLLHILPAKEKPASKEEEIYGPNGTKLSSVKKEKEKKRKNLASSDFNWNSLYMSSDAIADSIADRLGIAKSELLNAEADNVAVRLALAETQIISETKEFLEKHGIVLDNFGKKDRSQTVILVKNIPYGTTEEELRGLFGKFGDLGRVLIPPANTMAVIEFLEPSESRRAFQSLAYRRFKDTLIYLEKAPIDIFKEKFDPTSDDAKKINAKTVATGSTDVLGLDSTTKSNNNNDDEDLSAVSTLFVKNLNFETTAESLKKAFSGIQGYRSSRINVKPNSKQPGKMLSMGFGFVEFNNKQNAQKALDAMQGYKLDGHSLQLKFSHHEANTNTKKSNKSDKTNTTKLVVRNVPFEATVKDLRELFSAYGQLKSLRMPKKFNGGHRGFAFLDFMTKQEAKNVYEQMANIHLYGRHLVLEWAEEEEGIDSLREKTGKHYAKEESLNGRNNKRQKIDMDENDDTMLSD